MGAEVTEALVLIQRHRAQVKARGVDVGNVEVETIGQALRADCCGEHALAAVDLVHLVASLQRHAGHKRAVAGGLEQLLAVGGGFTLGLGVIRNFLYPSQNSCAAARHSG